MNRNNKTPITSVSSNQGELKKRIKKLTKWSHKSNSINERYLILQLVIFYQDQVEH